MKTKPKKSLAQKVKCKMLDLGLDKRGGRKLLATRMQKNPNSLVMALSEYRTGPAAEQLLKDALEVLNKWNTYK
jgi:hypothetical protein